MKTRSIIVKFEIPDTDQAEKILYDNLNCVYLKDFYKLQDNRDLIEKDVVLYKLNEAKKKTRKEFNDYLNKLKNRG